jgi:hypothetical protein
LPASTPVVLACPRQPAGLTLSFLKNVLDLAEILGEQKALTFVIFRKLLKALIRLFS